MSPKERRQAPSLAVDFQAVESQIDEICRQADERLRRLLEDDASSIGASRGSVQKQTNASGSLVPFEIRLGSTRLTLDEFRRKEIDDIMPLIDSEKGRVQIWSGNKMRASGVLLVVDGKLAVRVEELVGDINA